MSKVNNTKPYTAFRTLAGLHKALWLGAFERCSIPSSLMVRGACAVRMKVKKNFCLTCQIRKQNLQKPIYPLYAISGVIISGNSVVPRTKKHIDESYGINFFCSRQYTPLLIL